MDCMTAKGAGGRVQDRGLGGLTGAHIPPTSLLRKSAPEIRHPGPERLLGAHLDLAAGYGAETPEPPSAALSAPLRAIGSLSAGFRHATRR
jgi:hypothetical protein